MCHPKGLLLSCFGPKSVVYCRFLKSQNAHFLKEVLPQTSPIFLEEYSLGMANQAATQFAFEINFLYGNA